MIIERKHYYYAIAFILGSMINNIILHFRFNNDLLRREMLMWMQESNSGYFLGFAYFDLIFIVILVIVIQIIFRNPNKSRTKQSKSMKEDN